MVTAARSCCPSLRGRLRPLPPRLQRRRGQLDIENLRDKTHFLIAHKENDISMGAPANGCMTVRVQFRAATAAKRLAGRCNAPLGAASFIPSAVVRVKELP